MKKYLDQIKKILKCDISGISFYKELIGCFVLSLLFISFSNANQIGNYISDSEILFETLNSDYINNGVLSVDDDYYFCIFTSDTPYYLTYEIGISDGILINSDNFCYPYIIDYGDYTFGFYSDSQLLIDKTISGTFYYSETPILYYNYSCDCPSCDNSWSSVWINDIQHLGNSNIFIDIPEEISWDYSYTGDNMNIDIVGYNVDNEYIEGIIDIQTTKPNKTDFNNIIQVLLPLFVPGFVIILFIMFVFKLIKKIY